MEITLLMRIVGVGLLIAVGCQLLERTGRGEQSLLLSLAGVVFVLLLLVGRIGDLFSEIRSVFGL